jgi:hypothetical protein
MAVSRMMSAQHTTQCIRLWRSTARSPYVQGCCAPSERFGARVRPVCLRCRPRRLRRRGTASHTLCLSTLLSRKEIWKNTTSPKSAPFIVAGCWLSEHCAREFERCSEQLCHEIRTASNADSNNYYPSHWPEMKVQEVVDTISELRRESRPDYKSRWLSPQRRARCSL